MISLEHASAIDRVNKAIEATKSGGMVIMVDDEGRENEGDFVYSAAMTNPEKINFMTKHARGLICLALDEQIIKRLNLPMMQDSTKGSSEKETAFTVSIEAKEGVTTGISAADRSQTIKVAIDEKSGPNDIVVPGHIFPLKAQKGGVLKRAGHTEGSVDLMRLAGLTPAAVICEIMNDDGSMARRDDLNAISQKFEIPIVSIEDLIIYKMHREKFIEEIYRGQTSTKFGTFETVLFENTTDGSQHLAFIKGTPSGDNICDVRVHRQRILSDVFLEEPENKMTYGLRMLKDVECGVFVYLTSASHNQTLKMELNALNNRKKPSIDKDWVKKDHRTIGVGAQILNHLGVQKMNVHMSNPQPLVGLHGYGLEVVETIKI